MNILDPLPTAAFWASNALGWAGREYMHSGERMINVGRNLARFSVVLRKLPAEQQERGQALAKAIEAAALQLAMSTQGFHRAA